MVLDARDSFLAMTMRISRVSALAPPLPKPVHMAQLIAELRRAIDGAPAGA